MIRTQIQLEEEQYRKIKEMAAVYDVSMATLIRQSVDMFIEKEEKPSKEETRLRALAFVEKIEKGEIQFQDIEGKTDVSINHDEYFVKAATE